MKQLFDSSRYDPILLQWSKQNVLLLPYAPLPLICSIKKMFLWWLKQEIDSTILNKHHSQYLIPKTSKGEIAKAVACCELGKNIILYTPINSILNSKQRTTVMTWLYTWKFQDCNMNTVRNQADFILGYSRQIMI